MMDEREITCISCPVGCRMQVKIAEGAITDISGNTCKRGEVYAKQECLSPRRIVTAVAMVPGSPIPISVKTENPIPKEKIAECMREINALKLKLPIQLGDVLKENVAGTGVRLIATRTLI
ncbi:MAG: DUF1667 domain-containing protein [Christensenellales bacterium]|jgi:CxxC motif-containing protein